MHRKVHFLFGYELAENNWKGANDEEAHSMLFIKKGGHCFLDFTLGYAAVLFADASFTG